MLYLVNSEDLVNVSEAIRSSEAVSAESLEFPQGFIDAINAIINASGSGDVISTYKTATPSQIISSLTFTGFPTGKTIKALILVSGYARYDSRSVDSASNTTPPIMFGWYIPGSSGSSGSLNARVLSASSRYVNGSYVATAYGTGTATLSVNYDSITGSITLTKTSSGSGQFIANKQVVLYGLFA